MAAKKPQFEVRQGTDDKWYARLQAVNGKVLWITEGFERQSTAEEAIFRLIGIIQSTYYDLQIHYVEDKRDAPKTWD